MMDTPRVETSFLIFDKDTGQVAGQTEWETATAAVGERHLSVQMRRAGSAMLRVYTPDGSVYERGPVRVMSGDTVNVEL